MRHEDIIERLMNSDANAAKDRLLKIVDGLRLAGGIREANSLEKIVEKLERWQHGSGGSARK